MSWFWAVVAFVVGGWIGVVIMACMAMVGQESRREEACYCPNKIEPKK